MFQSIVTIIYTYRVKVSNEKVSTKVQALLILRRLIQLQPGETKMLAKLAAPK